MRFLEILFPYIFVFRHPIFGGITLSSITDYSPIHSLSILYGSNFVIFQFSFLLLICKAVFRCALYNKRSPEEKGTLVLLFKISRSKANTYSLQNVTSTPVTACLLTVASTCLLPSLYLFCFSNVFYDFLSFFFSSVSYLLLSLSVSLSLLSSYVSAQK